VCNDDTCWPCAAPTLLEHTAGNLPGVPHCSKLSECVRRRTISPWNIPSMYFLSVRHGCWTYSDSVNQWLVGVTYSTCQSITLSRLRYDWHPLLTISADCATVVVIAPSVGGMLCLIASRHEWMNVMNVMSVGVSLLDCGVTEDRPEVCDQPAMCAREEEDREGRFNINEPWSSRQLHRGSTERSARQRSSLRRDHRGKETTCSGCRRPFNCTECNASVSEKVL